METSSTELSTNKDAIRGILQNMGLINNDDPFSARPLTGGVSSNILKVRVGERQFCLKQALAQLKVEKVWHAPLERVFAEIEWMRTVAAIAPDAVAHIQGVDRDALCFAMDYLPAEQYANWKTQLLDGEIDVDFAAQLGGLLGYIHQKTARSEAMAAAFAYDDNFFSLRLDPYLGEIARVHPRYAERILAVMERTRNTKLALVHGDISPKNILRGPTGPVILDAECAWYGDPAFDLAFCLNHLLLKVLIADTPQAQETLLQACAALQSRYFSAITWETADAFEARVAALLPCLLLARVDGKSPVEYLNNAQAQKARRLSCALLDQQCTHLQAIISFWKKENGL